MSINKRKYLWQTALLTLLLSGVGGVGYYLLSPEHYLGAYPFIPIYFFVFGVFMINMMERCRMVMPKQMVQIYMLSRVIRMVFSLVVMLIYCIAVAEQEIAFLLTFVGNYFVYMIYDSWFFFTYEADGKLKLNKNKQDNETIA